MAVGTGSLGQRPAFPAMTPSPSLRQVRGVLFRMGLRRGTADAAEGGTAAVARTGKTHKTDQILNKNAPGLIPDNGKTEGFIFPEFSPQKNFLLEKKAK